MPNEFKLSGSRYVSKSGNDANAGTDPNAPKLTLTSLNGHAGSVIVGTGVYNEYNYDIDGSTVFGDGIVIFDGSGVGTFINDMTKNGNNSIHNLIVSNYVNLVTYLSGVNMRFDASQSVFMNGIIRYGNSGQLRGQYSKCVFINVTFTLVNFTSVLGTYLFTQCIFINCTINGLPAIKSRLRMTSCYLDQNTIVNEFGSITYSNVRGTIDATETIGNISADPIFIGTPGKNELTVAANSPMISGGLNGVNIGNVKTGKLQKSTSLEWGLSPAVNNNTRFDVKDSLEVITGNTGTRESKEIDMGQVVRSPVLRLNGFVDFLNNVPDFVALSNPNHLTVEVAYAGLDKVYTAYKSFRWNEKIQLDNMGKSTGDAGFDWGNTVETNFRFIKIRVTSRNNYTVA